MKSVILALAASLAVAGAAHAQQGTATAPEPAQEATTVPAEQAAPASSTDAAPSGGDPLSTEAEQEATTVEPTATPRRLPQAGTAASTEGENPNIEEPGQTSSEGQATTAQ